MLLQKMKSIPDAKFNKKKKKAIIFESKLNRFAQSRVRNILMSFKQSTYDANVKKKYCIDRLTRACMGENQKKYQLWRNIVREAKMLSHTEIFEKVFRNLHTVA